MRTTVASALALSALLLAGCSTQVRPVWLDDVHQPSREARYAPWGAYYVLDEVRIGASFSYNLLFNSLNHPTTKVSTHRKLRILSTPGMRHATMAVPQRWGQLTKLEATITDPSGIVRRIPASKVLAEYRRSGRIVFNDAVPGSTLEVLVEHEMSYFAGIVEEDFRRPVPVAHARLILDHLTWMKYSVATYGGLAQRDTTMRATNGFEVKRKLWEARDLLPRDELPASGWADAVVPRAVMVLRSADGRYSEPSTCNDLGERYGQQLAQGLFAGSSKARAFARELVRDAAAPRARAEAIHRFIVDSIRIVDEGEGARQNADARFAARRGTPTQMAHLYQTMLKEAGISSRIVFLRDRSRGGFDPSLPNRSQLETSMLVLDIDSSQVVAFPLCRSCALGEYPAAFFGLSALDLDRGECIRLPRSASDTARSTEEQWVSVLADGTLESRVRWTFDAYSALDVRSDFRDVPPSERESAIERWFQVRDPGNRVDLIRFLGLDRPGEPVVLEARIRNALVPRPLAGGLYQVSLAPLVAPLYGQMDTLRMAPWIQSIPRRSETVIHLPQGARARWTCPEVAGVLYSQKCVETQDGIRRTLALPVVTVAQDSLRDLRGELGRADLFRFSRLVLRP